MIAPTGPLRARSRGTALAFVFAACLAVPAARAQGWLALADAPRPAPPRLRAAEAGGAELAIERGALVRTSVGTAVAVEPTIAAGELRALVPSPGGTTFVIAAGGLFVAHPEVATLDRVDFAASVTAEPIVGVVADRVDRIWIATATALFVAHPGLWFHRRHGAADGLPAPPFHALEYSGGELRLHTAAGVSGYRPDPSVPRMNAVTVAGVGPGATARLHVHGEAGSEVDYLYRLASHHMLRPAAGTIDLRRPGRHHLLVYAVDRDLDLSAPLPLAVDVPHAGLWDARAAAAVGALLGAALAAWCFARARRAGRSRGRAALDAALVAIVALQLGMAMTAIGRTFPFIGFTMYAEVYREHDVLYTPAIVARTRDGTSTAPDGMLSFATDGQWRRLTSLLFADAAQQQAYVDGLPAGVHEVELRIRRCRLTAAGPREVAPFVLARLVRPERR